MLRELLQMADESVMTAALSSDITLHTIGITAGKAAGIESALHELTKVPK